MQLKTLNISYYSNNGQKISALIIIILLVFNIFSGYFNSWFSDFVIASIGSVVRDFILFFILLPLTVISILNNKHNNNAPTIAWAFAVLFTLFLVPFADNLRFAALGFRNIFYPLICIVILTTFKQNSKSIRYLKSIRYSFLIILLIIGFIAIVDFFWDSSASNFFGFNPAYNDLVALMVRNHLGLVRANAGVSDALNFGYLMVFSFVYSYYLLSLSKIRVRWLLWVVYVLSFMACILSLTRGAILSLMLIFFFIIYKKSKAIFILFVLVSLILIYTASFNISYVTILADRFTQTDDGSQQSSDTRIFAAIKSIDIILDKPLLGMGLGTQGAPTVLEGIDLRVSTDNSFFWILLDTGVIGFVLIMYAYFLTFLYLIKNSTNQRYKRFVLLSAFALIIAALLSSAPVSPTLALSFWSILTVELFLSNCHCRDDRLG